jgi:hypothetical protein
MYKRFFLTGAIVGLIIPAVLLAWAKITGALFGLVQVLVWPSSIILMATERPDVAPFDWLYLAASIALNCLWYALIATVFYLIYVFGARFFSSISRA